jgi:hypothetical protein
MKRSKHAIERVDQLANAASKKVHSTTIEDEEKKAVKIAKAADKKSSKHVRHAQQPDKTRVGYAKSKIN